jgi:cyclohexanecarboxylate-CoA ligase
LEGTAVLQAPNIWQLIERRAEATPDAEMLVDQVRRRLTFGEFRERAERVAAGLADLGVEADTVVSWQLPTWIESVVLVGALRRLGAVQNPILPIYRDREVGFIVRQATPRLLIVPSTFGGFDFADMARRLTADTATEVLLCDRELPEGDPATLKPAPTDDMDAPDAPVRWLFYTSGTTSDPKGAQHGDIAIRTAALGMARGLGLAADDRSALVFPFTHIGGITWMYAGLALGFANILDQAFNPATTVDVLRREDVTQAGAGTFFHQTYLSAQDVLPEGERLFPHVRTFPGGGAPKPPNMHRTMKERLGGAGIISGYGLTEAPILTMGSIADPDVALASTEGKAVAGVTLKLVTLDGREAAVGEEGEVRATGPQVTRGYLDPALDADAFDEDGWFRTGDLGRLDADGNLTITGRIKDVIIRKGENISAKELEDELFTHPKVADVAVVGLKDPERGERACAVVVTAEGQDDLTLDEMTAHLTAAGIITRKLPEQLEIVPALPRNPAGKILKFELRDRFQD